MVYDRTSDRNRVISRESLHPMAALQISVLTLL
jgi:hypothetical protein